MREVIGPTPCDERRTLRERKLRNAWDILVSAKHYKHIYSVVSIAVDLYREALSAYQNGAYMAAILMCGAALESLIDELAHPLMSKDRVECSDYGVLGYEITQVGYASALRILKEHGVVDGRVENRINTVRSRRNIVAHFSEKRLELLVRAIREQVAKRKLREEAYRILRGVERGAWASEEDAFATLKETAEIFKEVIDRAYEKLCVERQAT